MPHRKVWAGQVTCSGSSNLVLGIFEPAQQNPASRVFVAPSFPETRVSVHVFPMPSSTGPSNGTSSVLIHHQKDSKLSSGLIISPRGYRAELLEDEVAVISICCPADASPGGEVSKLAFSIEPFKTPCLFYSTASLKSLRQSFMLNYNSPHPAVSLGFSGSQLPKISLLTTNIMTHNSVSCV